MHARYQREEMLAALGYASLSASPTAFREGVLYCPTLNIDAFFVTLKKSEADYSPTTMYRDYPISPTLFHWESQSTTSVASPTGQRYLSGSSTKLLFVRQHKIGRVRHQPLSLRRTRSLRPTHRRTTHCDHLATRPPLAS